MPDAPLELTFDLDTLELGDLEILEDVTGVEPMELIADLQVKAEENKSPSLKVLMAIVLINLRRTNPEATLDDARHFKFANLKFKGTVDPTVPEATPESPEIPPTPPSSPVLGSEPVEEEPELPA